MPVTATMEYAHKPRSGIALGGIGTGGIELRQDGVFYNWNIFNNQPLGTGTRFPFPEESMLFFVVRYQVEGKPPRMKLLQINSGELSGGVELFHFTFPWMTGISSITSTFSFPFARLTYRDPDMPLIVELEAFSPFIPHDVKNSALPAAFFNFRIISTSNRPVDVMLMASMRSGVGYDVQTKQHHNTIQPFETGCLVEMSMTGMESTHPSFGSQALASLSPDTTYHIGWEARHEFYEAALRQSTLRNVDGTDRRNSKDIYTGAVIARERNFSTLAISRRLSPSERLEHQYVVGWNFPNLVSEHRPNHPPRWEGHYYTNFFATAGDVVRYAIDHAETLTAKTIAFHRTFYDSSLDERILDSINAQLNTFVTSTWLTKDSTYAIQEGLTSATAWGPMNTVDVAVYGGVMSLALFPELDQSMLRTHKAVQRDSGEISHGIDRNFGYFELETRPGVPTRVDLSGQYAILVIRNALWTGDLEFLRDMWDSVKRALDYILRERDQDSDFLPDMGGVNSSYDNLEMYGAATFTSSLWLSALMHVIHAAQLLDDAEAVARYQTVLTKAQASFEQKLWTGSYYRLYNDLEGKSGRIDEGCLTDQLIGEWCSRLINLPPAIDPARIAPILKRIYALSYETDIGVRNCSWMDDAYLHDVPEDCWWDQANTAWTGANYLYASFLLYEGLRQPAEQVMYTLDRNYRQAGLYFDHLEWGGHYYRPMSAWAILNGVLGLSIRCGDYRFAPVSGADMLKVPFVHPTGTAQFQMEPREGRVTITAAINGWQPRTLTLPAGGAAGVNVTVGGQAAACIVTVQPQEIMIRFADGFTLLQGESLEITPVMATVAQE